MENLHNKKITLIAFFLIAASVAVILNGCKASEQVTAKSGAQLWAENCQRCHNTPSPSTFSHDQWETIGIHMQSRALITDQEKEKIVAFLKQ